MTRDVYYRLVDTYWEEEGIRLYVHKWYAYKKTRRGVWVSPYPFLDPENNHVRSGSKFILDLSPTEMESYRKWPTSLPKRWAYPEFTMAVISYRQRKYATIHYAEQNLNRGKRGVDAAEYLLQNGVGPDDLHRHWNGLRAAIKAGDDERHREAGEGLGALGTISRRDRQGIDY